MLAITTAADALGVPPDELQELITSGRLAATYDGDTWRVPDELLPAAAELLTPEHYRCKPIGGLHPWRRETQSLSRLASLDGEYGKSPARKRTMASKGNLGGGDGSTEYNSGKAAGQPGGSQTCKEMGSVSTSRLPNDGAPRKSRGKPSGSKRQGMAY